LLLVLFIYPTTIYHKHSYKSVIAFNNSTKKYTKLSDIKPVYWLCCRYKHLPQHPWYYNCHMIKKL